MASAPTGQPAAGIPDAVTTTPPTTPAEVTTVNDGITIRNVSDDGITIHNISDSGSSVPSNLGVSFDIPRHQPDEASLLSTTAEMIPPAPVSVIFTQPSALTTIHTTNTIRPLMSVLPIGHPTFSSTPSHTKHFSSSAYKPDWFYRSFDDTTYASRRFVDRWGDTDDPGTSPIHRARPPSSSSYRVVHTPPSSVRLRPRSRSPRQSASDPVVSTPSPIHTSASSRPSYAATAASAPAPGLPTASVHMPIVWEKRKKSVYTLHNMPPELTASQVISTISAQLNAASKDVFVACLKDTRFKQRGVFHLNFTSPELLTELLARGFEVGGKKIGGGKLRCYVPNFGVVYDLTDARHALAHLGTVSDLAFVKDNDGIRVGGLKFNIIPLQKDSIDLLNLDGESYDIRYPGKINRCRLCHQPGHVQRQCPTKVINCSTHGLTHVCPEASLDPALICPDPSIVANDPHPVCTSDPVSTSTTVVSVPAALPEVSAPLATPVIPVVTEIAIDSLSDTYSTDGEIHDTSNPPPVDPENRLFLECPADVTLRDLEDALSTSVAFKYQYLADASFRYTMLSDCSSSKSLCITVHDANLAIMMSQLRAGFLIIDGYTLDSYTVQRHDGLDLPDLVDVYAWGGGHVSLVNAMDIETSNRFESLPR